MPIHVMRQRLLLVAISFGLSASFASSAQAGPVLPRWDGPAGSPIHMRLSEPKGSGAILGIAAGESHSAMVTADGGLWMWGSNEYGQLADGTTASRTVPKRSQDDVVQVFADIDFTLALKKDGSLWRWGAIPAAYSRGDFSKTKERALAPLQAFRGTVRLQRSGNRFERALGIAQDGAILDWPYITDIAKEPVRFGTDVREIAAGSFGSEAIREDGTMWRLAQYPVEPPHLVGEGFVHVVRGGTTTPTR